MDRTDTLQDDRPWTTAEVARYLSRDRETVRRWARSGRLRGLRDPGGGWRFDPADVRRLVEGPEPSDRAEAIAARVQAARAQLRMLRRAR